MADGKVGDLALAKQGGVLEFDGSAQEDEQQQQQQQQQQQVASVVPVVVGSIVQQPQIVVQTGSGRLVNITQSTPQGMQALNVAQVVDTPITEAVR